MKIKLYTLFFFLGFCVSAYAQEQSHELKLKVQNNKIWIRWAPKNYSFWKKGIDSGYVLQRIDIDSLAEGSNNWQGLNSSILKPMPLEQMKQTFGEKNMNAALAAQMLYGKTSVPNSDNLGEIIYNTKAEQDNKLGFLLLACSKDFNVAKGVALGFEDVNFDNNKFYAYRLIAIGEDTIYGNLNLKNVDLEDYLLPEVEIEFLEKSANLKWTLEGYPFWGYFIEKRNKKDKEWKRTTTSPIILINTNKDTIKKTPLMIATEKYDENYQVYEYRLVGIDDYGIENFGPVFTAFGADKTPPDNPDNIKADGIDENTIKLEWTWKNESGFKDAVGFRIDKAISNDFYFQPYSEILPINTRSFVDKTPARLGNNYYRVAAIDTAGNQSFSSFAYGMVYDSVAPSTPQNIRFSIDSNGIVKLNWDKPKEIDVFGYRVYFSNYYNHEFINLTGNPLDTNFFSDTISLKTLTKKAYYKIVALDYNFNHSKYSEAIEIKRPDKIKPQSPFFTNYFTDGTSVILNWIPSYSDDADVIIIKKRISGELNWIEIYQGKNGIDSTLEDKNVSRNIIYDYDIRAVDENGLISDAEKTLRVKIIPLQELEDVSLLKAVYNKDKNQIELSWQYGIIKDYYFVIYKSTDGINFSEIDFVDENNRFNDNDVKAAQQYFYKVKPVARKGASGKPSEKVAITTN